MVINEDWVNQLIELLWPHISNFVKSELLNDVGVLVLLVVLNLCISKGFRSLKTSCFFLLPWIKNFDNVCFLVFTLLIYCVTYSFAFIILFQNSLL